MPSKDEVGIDRANAQPTDLSALSQPFLVPLGSRSYSKQFAQLYDYRLTFLRKRILARAEGRWVNNFESFSQTQSPSPSPSPSQSQFRGSAQQADQEGWADDGQDEDGNENHTGESRAGPSRRSRQKRISMTQPPKHVERILDVRQGEVCYIVGNLYCAMPLKPDVLEDLTREQWLAPQPARSKFVDFDRDELFIEDQSGRVKLVGDAIRGGTRLRSMFITGTVAAVLGTETRAGDFEVVDAIFAGLPGPEGRPSNGRATKDEKKMNTDDPDDDDPGDKWVVLMSGLAIGGQDSLDSEIAMQFLTEWLTGELGELHDRQQSSKVVAAIIAGNSMAPPLRNEDESKTKRFGQDVVAYSPAPTLALDQYLTDLCSTMPVHILPGERDPASAAMPQQPIHFALLPRAGRFDSLRRETNPTWIGLGGRKILGTSGQNVDDIFKYVEEGDQERIEMACRILEWGHLAPTAPDTLWCYPFKATDPFLIRQRPDLLFVGNQPAYATALYHFKEDEDLSSASAAQDPTTAVGRACRVVLIPEFAKTRQVVLVNLLNLESRVVQVGASI